MVTRLPELPKGYFFRVSEGWFFGSTVKVQLRQKLRWWPFSVVHDTGWSTQEIMQCATDAEVAVRIAQTFATRLQQQLRAVDLRGLE